MSIRTVQGSGISPRVLKDRNIPDTTPWVRDPSWLSLTAVESTEQKFRGLIAVFPESNFTALIAQGAYTVDWGDGTTTNYSSNATALKEYDYNNANLSGTDAPVTLTDTGDLVQRTAHGYSNGMEVRFYNIATTTGITEDQLYYVINASANSFQISTTIGGSAVALTGNGSATLLPYKQAIVTVTPQAGQNLTLLNLSAKHTQSGLQRYESGWLDMEIGSPNFTSSGLTISSSSNIFLQMCRRVAIKNLGNVTSLTHAFYEMRFLSEVILPSTAAVTNMSHMFYNCASLQSVPLLNTGAVTSMFNMFNSCPLLQSVPFFNTALVTSMSGMFSGCASLQSVPLFNTAAVTNMSNMFYNCASLQSVPLFNTAAVTNMYGMFSGCASLQSVPFFNTAAVTSMSYMFYGCPLLRSVPLFNTALVTSMGSMFSGCASLQSVPLFNTAAVTDMSNMFYNCYSLQSIPSFNTAAVTNISFMCYQCYSLKSVFFSNISGASNYQFMFASCYSLQSIPLFSIRTTGTVNMGYMFNNCYSLQSIPLFNTAAVTTMSNTFSGCYLLKSIPALNVSAVTTLTNIFSSSSSITRIKASQFKFTFSVGGCKLSAAALDEIFTNLPTPSTSQTITVTGNFGIGSIVTKSLNTTAQSTTITTTDTANVVAGMFVTGTGTGITTGVSVTSDVTADTLTLTNHGLSNGNLVAFSSLGTTTGVSAWTIYYVINSTANTFQISLTSGGAAINLTGTNATMGLRYLTYVSSVNAGVSIILSTPAATTQTATSLSFRSLDSGKALLKNWTVSS